MASRSIVFAVFACLALGCFARSPCESSNESKAEIIRIERIQSNSGFLLAIGSFFERVQNPNPTTTIAADRYKFAVGLAAGVQSFLTTLYAVSGTSRSEIDETRLEFAEGIGSFADIVYAASYLAEMKNGDFTEIVNSIGILRERLDIGAVADLYFKLIPKSSKAARLKRRVVTELTFVYDNMFHALVDEVTVAYGGEAADTDFENPSLTATVSITDNLFQAISLRAKK